jgi:endonuclease-8
MPEGDTIHRTAATLRRVLAGQELTAFRAPRLRPPLPVAGTLVERVEARGKHLLIRFADGRTLHTHMRMNGSWHTYRPGERWRRSPGSARAVLETAEGVAVCFAAPVVELLDDRELARHPQLSRLGPDLCAPGADLDVALARLGSMDPATEIGVALLDQRVACGVGNVYKSEVLFACRVDPFAVVGSLDGPTRRELFAIAADLLRRNLEGGPRRTVPEGLAVYDRTGRPCRRCGTTIVSRRQGEDARTTWWCPTCQSAV